MAHRRHKHLLGAASQSQDPAEYRTLRVAMQIAGNLLGIASNGSIMTDRQVVAGTWLAKWQLLALSVTAMFVVHMVHMNMVYRAADVQLGHDRAQPTCWLEVG